MSAASVHLTPVTLELGGKCPALVDSLTSSWDREVNPHSIYVKSHGKSKRKSLFYLTVFVAGG